MLVGVLLLYLSSRFFASNTLVIFANRKLKAVSRRKYVKEYILVVFSNGESNNLLSFKR